MNWREKCESVFMVILGTGIVLLSLFADKLGMSGSTMGSMGRLRWLALLVGVGFLGIGFFHRKLSAYLAIRLPLIFVVVLILDNIIYFISPVLPKATIVMMSEDAQAKYRFFNKGLGPVVHNGKTWYWRPNIHVQDTNTGTMLITDELGYSNEPGELSRISKLGFDVLLLGNSFTEGGGPIEKNLHKDLFPLTVYSMAMGGQSSPHWSLHFDRWVHSTFFKAPRIVVLNFYGGNEITNTVDYLSEPKIPSWIIENNLIGWPKRKFSFFQEIITVLRFEFQYRKPSLEVQIDEKPSSIELDKVFVVLNELVEKIHQTNPQTKILLSYIPTPGAIYGPDYNHCLNMTHEVFSLAPLYVEACHEDIQRQKALSATLSKWSRALKIDYLDPTLQLRQAGQFEVLNKINNPHFNEEGGRIYAEAVAGKIREMLNIDGVPFNP